MFRLVNVVTVKGCFCFVVHSDFFLCFSFEVNSIHRQNSAKNWCGLRHNKLPTDQMF
jgi:hypothetical protein